MMCLSVQKFSDVLADVRLDPVELGKSLARSHFLVQERTFEMFIGFIKELSIQDQTAGYVNGNMELATRARALDFLLTDNSIV